MNYRKDGTTYLNEFEIAPIKNEDGVVTHFLSVQRDVTERQRLEILLQDAKEYSENIVESVREPLLVLSAALRVLTANHAFYSTFNTNPNETIGNFIYDLGNKQWCIPELRVLFEQILPMSSVFNGYEVQHDFPGVGPKTILLNAREIFRNDIGSSIILLAMEDITERKLKEELEHLLAYYDPLTKLANRLLLKDRLLQAMQHGERSDHYGALIFLDLDNFKPVNDLYGHDAGDCILQDVGKRLIKTVRVIDTVARLGGDEFVVLLTDLTGDHAQVKHQIGLIAEKIRITLAEPHHLQLPGPDTNSAMTATHTCSASIGVALFLGVELSHDALIKRADEAMYRAKKNGRNQIAFDDDS